MSESLVWLRSEFDPGEEGRFCDESDVDLVIRGNARVLRPSGEYLAVVRKGAVLTQEAARAAAALQALKSNKTQNRGTASGTPPVYKRVKKGGYLSKTNIAAPVNSSIIGYFERTPRFPYCRQTAFTADEVSRWEECLPLFQQIAGFFAEMEPKRYSVQKERAEKTNPHYVIPGTPFTTVTVNFDWRTAMHKDRGDLHEGSSCLAILGTGDWKGCYLVHPRYRVAYALHVGDLIVMDAHEFHGNTPLVVSGDGDQRMSLVLYYRTKMLECGAPHLEAERAKERRGALQE